MLDMFNKRKRTEKQDKKATAIILGSIKPFLQVELAGKVKNKERAGVNLPFEFLFSIEKTSLFRQFRGMRVFN